MNKEFDLAMRKNIFNQWAVIVNDNPRILSEDTAATAYVGRLTEAVIHSNEDGLNSYFDELGAAQDWFIEDVTYPLQTSERAN